RCLNGKLEFMLRWNDSPMAGDAPAGWGDKILHATLVIGDTQLLGGDVLPKDYQAPRGFSLLLNPGSTDEADRLFHALAEDGTVTMPLQETFWTPRFGSVIDRFGISWAVNYEKSE
ncbi:MAG TPA: VOC family protein, partial [Terriglobia bacterium]|nr:VOC family protein [Terriglobia bacterium]